MEGKNIVLRVSNLEKSIHFYEHVLGLNVLEASPEEAIIEAGGAHPHLHLIVGNAQIQPSGQPFHISVNVCSEDGLKEIYKRSLRAEVEIVGFPGTNVMPAIYLVDPDGAVVEAGVDLPPVSFTSAEWSSALWSTSKWLVKEERIVNSNKHSSVKNQYTNKNCEDAQCRVYPSISSE